MTIKKNDVDINLNILIMDDEEFIREIFVELLGELNHRVAESVEGAEAVELYKKSVEAGDPFDIVFLDLTIKGGLGGRETVKLLREINPNVKVVVSSGYSDSSISKYKEDGFNSRLNKPFTIEELQLVISEILDEG